MQPSVFDINQLISGALTMGYLVVMLFFLRFWRKTRDRLFMLFSLAFGILAMQRLLLATTTEVTENVTYLYVLRLAAFVIIIIAIIEKNRSSTS